MEKNVTLEQSLDDSQSSTHSARLATAPGEGDVYNFGVACSSHAWPANVIVGTSCAATVEKAKMNAWIRIRKSFDGMLFETCEQTCETFSKKREGVTPFPPGQGV